MSFTHYGATSASSRLLIDNGVYERILRKDARIVADVLAIQDKKILVMCAAQVGEFLFNARNQRELDFLRDTLAEIPELDPPSKNEVLAVHHKILARYHRGVGAIDAHVVAHALKNKCAVVTFDKDFVLAHHVCPELEVFRLRQTED